LSARFVQLAGAAVWTFAHLSDIASDRLICGNRAGWFLFCSVLDTLFSQLDRFQDVLQNAPLEATVVAIAAILSAAYGLATF
jgi:hypothetical protein